MITVKSYAKINLSIDVGAARSDGMHPVDMIMQQASLYDDVTIDIRRFEDVAAEQERDYHTASSSTLLTQGRLNDAPIEIDGGFSVQLKVNANLPRDRENIAFRAAELMASRYGDRAKEKGVICIFINKRVPIAAGLGGGSGNAAAVLHGLNAMWELGLSLDELLELGSLLGSDVPFSVMAQARKNFSLPDNIKMDSGGSTCARARGTGTEVTPVRPIKEHLVIARPRIGVSTKTVYQGIDSCIINERPDNDALCDAILRGSIERAIPNMINVLENYTLTAHPEVAELKSMMIKCCRAAEERELAKKESGARAYPRHVLMSGSGPTVFAIMKDPPETKEVCEKLKSHGYEAFACETN